MYRKARRRAERVGNGWGPNWIGDSPRAENEAYLKADFIYPLRSFISSQTRLVTRSFNCQLTQLTLIAFGVAWSRDWTSIIKIVEFNISLIIFFCQNNLNFKCYFMIFLEKCFTKKIHDPGLINWDTPRMLLTSVVYVYEVFSYVAGNNK